MQSQKVADNLDVLEDAISPPELEALKRFKGIILARGYQYPARGDDQTLLRFLRARQLDLKKAATMYGEYVQWRRETKIDSILQTFKYPELDQVLQAWPQMWHKTDKLGRPINIQILSRMKVKEVFHATTEERMLMRALWVWEELHEIKLPACSKAAGHYIGRATVILDLKDVSVTTFTNGHARRVLLKMAQLFSRYYPEYLGRLIIINAPASFKVLWELLSPFIDQRTQNKIGIHKGNGLEDLLRTVNEDDLPAFLGGKCQCPGGCEHALTGPWNDERYR
ncbi:hypothetical protein O6H91_03G105400 [Diphasiastrum complanatum]|uniref:Uncharacterized protein n=1 Tax=Diphasiastrum complanatum TaxID=34168 RepID=A0ACC2E9Y5_DIPCM|nr:hypothetical protein O6H91_03G105400 [Diphasiastrum complanatum]